jgi:hypothetical protein
VPADASPPPGEGAPIACRPACGACCVAPSISGPIPGMPRGKPAGVRCVQLTEDDRCAIFGRPERPACCAGLRPSVQMCGETREQALAWLRWLEASTLPGATAG